MTAGERLTAAASTIRQVANACSAGLEPWRVVTGVSGWMVVEGQDITAVCHDRRDADYIALAGPTQLLALAALLELAAEWPLDQVVGWDVELVQALLAVVDAFEAAALEHRPAVTR